jgi:hypothetical protein
MSNRARKSPAGSRRSQWLCSEHRLAIGPYQSEIPATLDHRRQRRLSRCQQSGAGIQLLGGRAEPTHCGQSFDEGRTAPGAGILWHRLIRPLTWNRSPGRRVGWRANQSARSGINRARRAVPGAYRHDQFHHRNGHRLQYRLLRLRHSGNRKVVKTQVRYSTADRCSSPNFAAILAMPSSS